MTYRYIGNKRRILPFVLDRVDALVEEGSTVADLMCGTATVSAGFKSRGHRVLAGDLMTFSVQHAIVRLSIHRPPRFARLQLGDYAQVLDHLNRLRPRRGLIFREYSPGGSPPARCRPRMYLTEANAKRVDAIRRELRRWREAGLLSRREDALLHHDLILAVNRVANIAGTYGHYRSKWNAASMQPLQLRPTEIQPAPRLDHRVYQGPAEQVARRVRADLCYLDPPYMKRQYAANYHLPETLARGDSPQANGVSGLRDWWDQYSDFCSKRRVRGAFDQVITRADCPIFLISYSEDGLLSRAELTSFLGDYGRVRCHVHRHARFRSNAGGRGGRVLEFLFELHRT